MKYSSNLYDPARARAAAQKLMEEWDLVRALQPFEAYRISKDPGAGREKRPMLHLEDVTGIPFVEGVPGVEEYQHRARVRAESGDLFAAGTEQAPGYEDYCRELGLGSPEFVLARGRHSMAVARACMEEEPLERLVARAKEGGGLVIQPYMAIESVWELARAIQERAKVPVSVLGPPPPVLWAANDKSQLSRVVEESLGQEWIVETRRGTAPEALAAHLSELAARWDWVGLKRTRCASAMGNMLFDARMLRQEAPESFLGLVQAFLKKTEWVEGEEVLVVEWRPTDLSPSTQLWIPPVGHGTPLVEGVYEQILEGPERMFVGSRPSTMPLAVNEALSQASLQVATVLQQLGYVGRCSFDFIITGELDGEFVAKFVECNGRWGGTSTPMRLVDRLVAGERPAYIATDTYVPESHRGITFLELKSLLHDHLFDPETGEGRFVLYNVGPLGLCGKFDIISLGTSPADARRGLEEVLPTCFR